LSHPVNKSAIARAHCLCGAIQIQAALPSKWVAHCHCSRCQRAHGAGVVTWVGFEAGQVSVIDPTDALRWHEADTGASRGFCSRCGTPMLFKSPRWPGELHIARALFIDALDREPQGHVHVESAVPWLHLGDALPRKRS
jgi:hypothetical protein